MNPNIRLVCKASSSSFIGARRSGTTYKPARIAIQGVIWTSPIPTDGHECAYINESIDLMLDTSNTEQPTLLKETA
jgi:hypothetical protein